jgi:hypothetical protein
MPRNPRNRNRSNCQDTVFIHHLVYILNLSRVRGMKYYIMHPSISAQLSRSFNMRWMRPQETSWPSLTPSSYSRSRTTDRHLAAREMHEMSPPDGLSTLQKDQQRDLLWMVNTTLSLTFIFKTCMYKSNLQTNIGLFILYQNHTFQIQHDWSKLAASAWPSAESASDMTPNVYPLAANVQLSS